MGWTVLYIAFGIVALWLLGEVLLQYKARLRWRLLAFTGFMGVVLGVLMPSVFVIALGAIAFAVGQTYVTLSFRRGFSTGWALGGSPGASRRRRAAGGGAEQEPLLQVSGLEYEPAMRALPGMPAMDVPMDAAMTATMAAVYAPEPLPDDTGQYGAYKDDPAQQNPYGDAFDAFAGYGQAAAEQPYAAQDPYADQDAYDNGQDVYAAQDTGQGAGQDSYAQYGYGTDQPYAAYSDPYIGTADGGGQPGAYDSYGGGQQYADPYADQQQYSNDTPPGGIWVPQQRESDHQVPPMPQEQPREYGYDPGYDNNEQYRY